MRLLTVIGGSPLSAALKDGRVRPEGVELAFEEVDPVNAAFRRMCRELAFDVSEMAATTYFVAREVGKPFTALPIFLTRGFHHGAIWAREPADPRSLEGKRVGVSRGYTVTTAVWARGILSAEHGVDLDRVTWVRSGAEHVAEYVPPPNVEDLEEGADLAEAVLAGELAAVVGDVRHPGLVPLLADADAAADRYLREHRNWPVNHLVVIRDEHLEHAPAVYDAFERARALYLAGGELEPMHARAAEVMDDPVPYGLEPNRTVLEELVEHAVRQRILSRRPSPDELFTSV